MIGIQRLKFLGAEPNGINNFLKIELRFFQANENAKKSVAKIKSGFD